MTLKRSLKVMQTGTIRKLGCDFLFAFLSNMAVFLPFMRYSASKNSVTLKKGLGVVQGHWKCRRSIDHTTFYWSVIVRIVVCCCITFKLFDVESSWPWKGHWRSFKLVTFEKHGCGFLFAFHSNYGRIFNRLWDIQSQRIAWPWKLG